MAEARITMLGLPHSGKSTYLGALWHFVEEPSVSEVSEASVPGDRKHIRALAKKVRAMEELTRTKMDVLEQFSVPVLFADGLSVELRIPDVSGEQLQSVVHTRHWPEILATELESSAGLMFFINPLHLRLPLSLWFTQMAGDTATTSVPAAAPETDEIIRDLDAMPNPDEITSGAIGYANKRACTAAQVIDALELALEAADDRWPIRVALVISAFDQVQDRTPRSWLAHRLPALGPFLEHNRDRLDAQIFGVSAQGGAIKDRLSVLKLGELHERAWVRDADGNTVDFSAPVRWTLR